MCTEDADGDRKSVGNVPDRVRGWTAIESQCPYCGYDLRGTPGDPVRCSECGMVAERSALRVSQRELVARCRGAESRAVLCIAGMWLLATAVGLWFAMSPCLSAASGVPGIALWFGGIASYRVACEDRPGWLSALAWYHLANGIWMVALTLVGWVAYTTFDLFPEKVWTVYLPLAVLLLSIAAHVVLKRVKPTW